MVGEGAVYTAPDVMRLLAGVEVREAGPGEAFAASRRAAARLTGALLAAGIAETDLRTGELSLGPEYEAYPEVSGYRAAQGVEAVVRELDKADTIINAVAEVGEEIRLNGLVFEVSEAGQALETARARAFADAAAKAAHYAGLAGRPLGRVVSIGEESGAPPQPLTAVAEAMRADGSISPGRQRLTVAVRVVYGFAG